MLLDCQYLNRLTGNRGRLHSAHWLASRLKLAARCPVSGCWLSCTLTRGHCYKLFKGCYRVNAQKYFLSNRITEIWNALPSAIVEASSCSFVF